MKVALFAARRFACRQNAVYSFAAASLPWRLTPPWSVCMKLTTESSAPARSAPAAPFVALDTLKDLVRRWIVPKAELLRLPAPTRREMMACRVCEDLLSMLVDWRLLTAYQAQTVLAGKSSTLVLGNYRVLEPLGRGSMGSVYRGEHRALRLPVAIKVLRFRDDHDSRRLALFRNEIATVARLSHPHIVAPIDVGGAAAVGEEGTVLHYFVMEYLSGHDLEQHVRLRGAPSIEEACRWGSQVASALVEAQRHRLVHRDLKPANVLITHDGRAKLLDFGLALHTSADLPGTGHIVGTVDYMAPEQFDDPYRIDGRADLYSLGGVLFFALTGRKPFPGEGRDFVDFHQRLTLPPPSPRLLRPEVPRVVDMLVRRLLMLRPEDRLDSPYDAARVLRKFAGRQESP